MGTREGEREHDEAKNHTKIVYHYLCHDLSDHVYQLLPANRNGTGCDDTDGLIPHPADQGEYQRRCGKFPIICKWIKSRFLMSAVCFMPKRCGSTTAVP